MPVLATSHGADAIEYGFDIGEPLSPTMTACPALNANPWLPTLMPISRVRGVACRTSRTGKVADGTGPMLPEHPGGR